MNTSKIAWTSSSSCFEDLRIVPSPTQLADLETWNIHVFTFSSPQASSPSCLISLLKCTPDLLIVPYHSSPE